MNAKEPVYKIGTTLFSIPGASERQHLTLRDDQVVAIAVGRHDNGQIVRQFLTLREIAAEGWTLG